MNSFINGSASSFAWGCGAPVVPIALKLKKWTQSLKNAVFINGELIDTLNDVINEFSESLEEINNRIDSEEETRKEEDTILLNNKKGTIVPFIYYLNNELFKSFVLGSFCLLNAR